jgi:hypothetical protein
MATSRSCGCRTPRSILSEVRSALKACSTDVSWSADSNARRVNWNCSSARPDSRGLHRPCSTRSPGPPQRLVCCYRLARSSRYEQAIPCTRRALLEKLRDPRRGGGLTVGGRDTHRLQPALPLRGRIASHLLRAWSRSEERSLRFWDTASRKYSHCLPSRFSRAIQSWLTWYTTVAFRSRRNTRLLDICSRRNISSCMKRFVACSHQDATVGLSRIRADLPQLTADEALETSVHAATTATTARKRRHRRRRMRAGAG